MAINKLGVIIFIIGLLVGGFFGYGYGFQKGFHLAVVIGLKFVDIDVNVPMLEQAIFQYKNQIGGCLFAQNDTNIFGENIK